MSSQSINDKTSERLRAIDEAIVNLKRRKNKLSIAKIAGISRKTIYNHAELKERCDQAIHVQQLEQDKKNTTDEKVLSRREILEDRYKRSKEDLKREQEKNAILLENNRQLVLEKDRLKSHIQMLQQKIERMNELKLKQI